jgi:hypothetical protein
VHEAQFGALSGECSAGQPHPKRLYQPTRPPRSRPRAEETPHAAPRPKLYSLPLRGRPPFEDRINSTKLVRIFLALSMQKHLDDLARQAGLAPEWKGLLRDLDRLQQVRIHYRAADFVMEATPSACVPVKLTPERVSCDSRGARGSREGRSQRLLEPLDGRLQRLLRHWTAVQSRLRSKRAVLMLFGTRGPLLAPPALSARWR